ncbi:MAG: GxxExxY protein [Pirellula sp.]|nr:GxxExxY protein [Pirellula sp.]
MIPLCSESSKGDEGIGGDRGDEDKIKEGTGVDSGFDDEISRRIIESVIRVHRELGPGSNESIYQKALLVDFANTGLAFECEKVVDILYQGVNVGVHRLDLVVEGQIILELKVVEQLSKAHYAQLKSYLHAAKLEVGLLINFANEKADFRRVVVPQRK